jgi:hypothetical protein
MDAYRRRALELVNSGRAQAESLPGSLVTPVAGGAYVEVSVWVPSAALRAPQARCWRRGTCPKCAAAAAHQAAIDAFVGGVTVAVLFREGIPMTEQEAWLTLALLWDVAYEAPDESVVVYFADGKRAHGLCGSISLLPGLTGEQRATMNAKVALPDGSYRWPLTLEGAAQRAAFCREQAALLA